ncbi:unnamed protein product, partial [marine sediment metagenome]
MKLSFAIPAFNERDNIGETIHEILAITGGIDYIKETQIIVVDDHSSDDTFEIIKNEKDPRIEYLRLSRRSGSHTALRAGIFESRGDAVICMSADGQDNPACIKEMLAKWREGSKVVWALRRKREKEPWYVSKPAGIFYKLLFLLGNAERSHVDLSRADFYLL